MTPDEVKQSITSWCSSDDDLEIASDRFEPGTDFSFGLKAGTLSTAPVDLVVSKAAGADRVTVRRSVTLTGDNVDAANRLIASRPGSVTAAVERSGLDTTVVAQTYVYLDGLSKHTFVQAVAELARTSTLLDAIGGVEAASAVDAEAATVASDAVDADSEPDSTSIVDVPVTPEPSLAESTFQQPSIPQPSSMPAGVPVAQPLPTPSFTPQPLQAQPVQPSYTPQPVQPYQAQPVQSQPVPQPAPAGGWTPSHSVPPQGMRAWGAPDPSGPVVANLAPGLPIQVAEVRGAWARVICSNGWTGWVDGRIIGVAA
ncbi:MAG: SH3 domain-containing protein [Candidatus Dormibacteria bacterium]